MRRPPKLLVLAMDIGSSSTRAALFNEAGQAVPETSASREYAVRYTPDGGATLPPTLVRRAAADCLRKTLRARLASPSLRKIPISGVGTSAFWHSLLGLDGKGRPLTPIFTWADSRCTADAAQLRREFDERKIHAQTGCMLRASFWPAKLRWLQRTQRRLFKRVVRWVSPAEWIFDELFGASGCSYSMASATGLYDLRANCWNEALCEVCGVRVKQLGTLATLAVRNRKPSAEFRDAQIFTALGDGAASNLGCGADRKGRIAINIGTSAAVRMLDLSRSESQTSLPFGLFRYAVDIERTVLGGAVSNAGNLRRWCLRELRVGQSAAEAHKILSRAAAACDEITILPFWVNERAPTWPENLRGTIIGLNQTTSGAQILRATTCSMFYRLGEILDLIETAAGRAKEVIVSGGVLHSIAALRLLADSLGRDVRVSTEPEASLHGAAIYVLEKIGRPIATLGLGGKIRHDPALAEKHRSRRVQQMELERTLSR